MSSRVAAFYDVDGTLVDSTVVHPCVWYASHQAIPSQSLGRTLGLFSRIPFYWALDQLSRTVFNALFYREYRGMTRNRLITLADQMFAAVLLPRIYPGAAELVARSTAQGVTQVLITGALDFTVEPLARHLGIPHIIANRLRFRNGGATGEIEAPIIAATTKADAMRDFAAQHAIDLQHSYSYSDSASDLPMLEAVGHPTAICPEARLRRAAQVRRWPVIEWS